MADFEKIYPLVLDAEGGYEDHNNNGGGRYDSGGRTFAGISYNNNKNTKLWDYLDKGDWKKAKEEAKRIARDKYWDAVKGDQIKSNIIAYNIYDFGFNAGESAAIKLAQILVEADVDGIIGTETLSKINNYSDEENFILKYFMLKTARYNRIAKDKKQLGNLRGWINRSLEVLSVRKI